MSNTDPIERLLAKYPRGTRVTLLRWKRLGLFGVVRGAPGPTYQGPSWSTTMTTPKETARKLLTQYEQHLQADRRSA